MNQEPGLRGDFDLEVKAFSSFSISSLRGLANTIKCGRDVAIGLRERLCNVTIFWSHKIPSVCSTIKEHCQENDGCRAFILSSPCVEESDC